MLERGYRNAILLTSDVDAATGGHWELGPFPLSNGLGVMAGWTVASDEGGVPPAVAQAFARAMTRYGRVTFPCSTIDAPARDRRDGETRWRQVQAKGDNHALFAQEAAGEGGGSGAWDRLFSVGRGLGAEKTAVVSLLSTLQEETVAELLFEDPHYQWWNASQLALVSRPPEKLPESPWRFVGKLFEDGWAAVAAAAAAATLVEVVMRSGVDGDVCGFVFANAEVRRVFEGLLEVAAAEDGLVVRTVSCADFAQLLSEALSGSAGD